MAVGNLQSVHDAPAPLSITTTDDALVVTGEIDAQTAPVLATALTAEGGRHELVLDMAGVEFVDSSGLRVLLESHNERLADHRRLVLRRPSSVVSRLLEVAGVSDYLVVDNG